MPDQMVQALLAERAGYVRRALPERVAAVDEQLALRGYDTSTLPRANGDDVADEKSETAAGQRAASATTPPKGRRKPAAKEQT